MFLIKKQCHKNAFWPFLGSFLTSHGASQWQIWTLFGSKVDFCYIVLRRCTSKSALVFSAGIHREMTFYTSIFDVFWRATLLDRGRPFFLRAPFGGVPPYWEPSGRALPFYNVPIEFFHRYPSGRNDTVLIENVHVRGLLVKSDFHVFPFSCSSKKNVHIEKKVDTWKKSWHVKKSWHNIFAKKLHATFSDTLQHMTLWSRMSSYSSTHAQHHDKTVSVFLWWHLSPRWRSEERWYRCKLQSAVFVGGVHRRMRF